MQAGDSLPASLWHQAVSPWACWWQRGRAAAVPEARFWARRWPAGGWLLCATGQGAGWGVRQGAWHRSQGEQKLCWPECLQAVGCLFQMREENFAWSCVWRRAGSFSPVLSGVILALWPRFGRDEEWRGTCSRRQSQVGRPGRGAQSRGSPASHGSGAGEGQQGGPGCCSAQCCHSSVEELPAAAQVPGPSLLLPQASESHCCSFGPEAAAALSSSPALAESCWVEKQRQVKLSLWCRLAAVGVT